MNAVEKDDLDLDAGRHLDDGLVLFGAFDEVFAHRVGSFARAHPGVQVELMCTRSVHLQAALQREEIDIGVDIGLGKGRAKVWTCDLTDGYIRINGAYRS